MNRTAHFLFVCLTASLAAAEVIDPGTGARVARGRIGDNGNVEVRSGIVSASIDGSFGGVLTASGGTLELTDLGEPEGGLAFAAKASADATAPIPFAVRQNAECDWFEVTPSSGTIAPGGETSFTIALKTNVMTNRHFYRGAFFVGTSDGLSRPFSLDVETDFVPPFRAARPGATAIYADLEHPVSGSPESGEAEYAFDVPKAGNYWFLIHGASSSGVTIQAAVDGDDYAKSKQQVHIYPTWTMVAPGKAFGDYMRVYALTAGRHTLRVKVDRATFAYDGLVLTDNPESFEPR